MKLANKKLVYNHKMTEEQYDEWLDIQYDLEKLVEKKFEDEGEFEVYIGESRQSEATYFELYDEETGETFEVSVRNHENRHFGGLKEYYKEVILANQNDVEELQANVFKALETGKQKLIEFRPKWAEMNQ